MMNKPDNTGPIEWAVSEEALLEVSEELNRMDQDFPFRFEEADILYEIQEYIESTYGQHYVGESDKIQTVEFLDSLGKAGHFCHTNAIKYLSRYGKKDGHNLKDLHKAVHYIVLLIHFDNLLDNDGEALENF